MPRIYLFIVLKEMLNTFYNLKFISPQFLAVLLRKHEYSVKNFIYYSTLLYAQVSCFLK